ncbi:MAG: indole-3-glycerol phosphate synthase TrpC [Deltaproteobacteria bacterium]
MNILREIIEHKKEELRQIKGRPDYHASLMGLKKDAANAGAARDFLNALKANGNETRIIAEIKKASPSRGVIRDDFNPIEIARDYEQGGAAAISVLTDKRYFQGAIEHLRDVRKNVGLPVLRKDFIIDEFQIYEAKAAGADAVLLIAAVLAEDELREFKKLSERLSLYCLVEVHDEVEMKKAAEAGFDIIGINNRDLNTFKVDISTTKRLAPLAPKGAVVVSESGIGGIEDIIELKRCGVNAFLVGTALVKELNPRDKLKGFMGK